MGNKLQPNRRLPAFVSSFSDRHGKTRHRFRRAGSQSYYFRSDFDTPEFSEEYELFLANSAPTKQETEIGVMRRLMRALSERHGREIASFVYAVGDPTGPVKIGFATAPVQRFIDLQIGNPRRLSVVALRAGDRVTEASLHSRLSHARVSGEWFEREAVLRLMKWRGVWLTPTLDVLSNHDESNANAG